MFVVVLAVASLQMATDTVTLDVAAALELGVEQSAVLAASSSRLDAASGLASQATAWPNPTISVTAENVGQQVEFTGQDGFRGLEGQAVLKAGLPIGPERSGAVPSGPEPRAATFVVEAARARFRAAGSSPSGSGRSRERPRGPR